VFCVEIRISRNGTGCKERLSFDVLLTLSAGTAIIGIYIKTAMTGNARAGALYSEPENGASPEKARAGESPPSGRLKGFA
jgi:hypothetical protein